MDEDACSSMEGRRREMRGSGLEWGILGEYD